MAFIGDELRTYLKTKTAITAKVGGGSTAKIWQDAPKQGAKPPFIVFTFFEGESTESLSAIGGVAERRCQVDCYDANPSKADALQEVVRLAPLQGYRGTMGTTEVQGVISPGTARSGADPPPQGSKAYRYWSSRDYMIAYVESTS